MNIFKRLFHVVDIVLYFEGEGSYAISFGLTIHDVGSVI